MKQLSLHLVRVACGISLMALAGAMPGVAQNTAAGVAVPHGPGSLAGFWINADYKWTGLPASTRALKTIDGKAPPLLPGPAKLLQQRIDAADRNGEIFSNTLTECLPGGIPEMLWGAAYPNEIVETPSQVTELFEEQNHFRTIPLNTKHQPDPDPSYMGDSVGHWEGDTLVVDTIAIKDNTTLDMVGTPHTDKLHVVERYRRVAPDKLEINVTIDDPGAFTTPWEAKVTWKAAPPGTVMQEYICENNRNGPDQNGNTSFGTAPRY